MAFAWFGIYDVYCYVYSDIIRLYYRLTGLEGICSLIRCCGVFSMGYMGILICSRTDGAHV